MIVQAGLDGVLVVAETRSDDLGWPAREGGVAEIVILVLDIGRPVRREHVFETGADRVAVTVVAVGGEVRRRASEADSDIRIVAPGIAALGVQQRRTPRVAEAAGHRTELIGIAGYHTAGRKRHAGTAVAGEPAILRLGTDDPIGRELIVVAALDAAEKT